MRYAVKRLFSLAATMVLVSLLAFAAFELIHGDTASAMLGTQATAGKVEALREELGLNRPLLVRYSEWLLGFFTGDLGISSSYHQPVWELIAPKVAVTLWLSLLSFVLIAAVSIPLGLWSAGRPRAGISNAFNQFCMAVPPFFTGILLSWIFGLVLKWFTPGRFPDIARDLPGALRYLFFAAVSIAIPRIAMTVRMLRSTVQGELRKDYVRTAISEAVQYLFKSKRIKARENI